MNGKIDLNDLANKPDHQLSIVPREEPSEREARLEIERANAVHKRRIDFALHIAAFVVVGVALCLCVWAIVRESSTGEDKRWATTLLTAIVTGFVGYVTGRSTK
jgi:lipopolysaccharide/colanic/teichoic acid biosynthesis glycosyltransferase